MLSEYWRDKDLWFLDCNVIEFQRLIHIKDDGIYGSITNTGLIEYIKNIQTLLNCSKIDRFRW